MKTLYTFLLMLLCLYSHACTCTGKPEDSHGETNLEWMSKFPLVFTARIDSVTSPVVDEHGIPASWEHYYEDVYVTVHTVFKGDMPVHLTINPPYYGSSCAFNLADDTGRMYLFFGEYCTDGTVSSHFCYGSTQLLPDSALNEPGVVWYKKYKNMISLLDTWHCTREGHIRAAYTNGKTMGGGKMKNGKPEGLWKHYNYYGGLTSQGTFKNGLKSGIWMERDYLECYNHKTNKSFPCMGGEHRGAYLEDKKTGVWTEYQYTTLEKIVRGKKQLVKHFYPVARGAYVAGVQEGIWVDMDESGKITKTTVYRNGLEVK